MGIEACEKAMPGKPQVAVFDTAFHMTMPPKAYRYAIPTKYYEEDHLRRYGFHGTSHRFVSKRAIELMGKPASELKIVVCHLGNGSSLSAVADGKCQDTSMGLSPLAGVPMGTRSGDIDTCVAQFIMNKYHMSADECLTMLNKSPACWRCRTACSSDFRDLEAGAAKGDKACRLALDKFCYEVRSTSARMPRRWAVWTASCSRPASAKTARRPARRSARVWNSWASSSIPRAIRCAARRL